MQLNPFQLDGIPIKIFRRNLLKYWLFIPGQKTSTFCSLERFESPLFHFLPLSPWCMSNCACSFESELLLLLAFDTIAVAPANPTRPNFPRIKHSNAFYSGVLPRPPRRLRIPVQPIQVEVQGGRSGEDGRAGNECVYFIAGNCSTFYWIYFVVSTTFYLRRSRQVIEW